MSCVLVGSGCIAAACAKLFGHSDRQAHFQRELRPADHITALDNGSDLHQVAGYFLTSAESVQKYGVNPTTQQFVTQLYANVLHRAPDPSGEAYWENALVKGLVSRADALAFFSESSENQANVIGAIQNGIVYTV
jgi:hypothetical protein